MTEPLPRMFVSTLMYAACKNVGNTRWPEVLRHLLAHPEEGPDTLGTNGLAFATMHEARHVAECVLHVASNTYVPRARCVTAAHFLRGDGKGCDVWLTCDDDTFTDRETIRKLVTACRATRGLVALPSTNRDGNSMCYRRVFGPTEWWEPPSADGLPAYFVTDLVDDKGPNALPLRRVDRVGQGCVAMHRDFIERLDRKCTLRFRDRQAPDALDCAGLFLAGPQDGDWVGEDYWLCGLAEAAGLPRHVLLEAPIQHEALISSLDLEGRVCLRGHDEADTKRAVERMTEAVLRMNEDARAAGLHP